MILVVLGALGLATAVTYLVERPALHSIRLLRRRSGRAAADQAYDVDPARLGGG
jgi:hypothetical protein